ncbi:unnamed protein product [Polarella glacialis]|uniref:Uncharacterized protein n=2 Tax=Polarella glacialis TaxID=89957 RepID=A0A813FUY4_POLGL|nr:unnamed protein product [Polarella glacialis]
MSKLVAQIVELNLEFLTACVMLGSLGGEHYLKEAAMKVKPRRLWMPIHVGTSEFCSVPAAAEATPPPKAFGGLRGLSDLSVKSPIAAVAPRNAAGLPEVTAMVRAKQTELCAEARLALQLILSEAEEAKGGEAAWALLLASACHGAALVEHWCAASCSVKVCRFAVGRPGRRCRGRQLHSPHQREEAAFRHGEKPEVQGPQPLLPGCYYRPSPAGCSLLAPPLNRGSACRRAFSAGPLDFGGFSRTQTLGSATAVRAFGPPRYWPWSARDRTADWSQVCTCGGGAGGGGGSGSGERPVCLVCDNLLSILDGSQKLLALTVQGPQQVLATLKGKKLVENRFWQMTPGWYALHVGSARGSRWGREACLRHPDLPCQENAIPQAPFGHISGLVHFSEVRTPAECGNHVWASGPLCHIVSKTIQLEWPFWHRGNHGLWQPCEGTRELILEQLPLCRVRVNDLSSLSPNSVPVCSTNFPAVKQVDRGIGQVSGLEAGEQILTIFQ